MRKLSLGQMRAIEAVARLGSFSAAAKDIGVSQPSVSTHVQSVESHFGVRLFLRDGHTTTTTPMLETILPSIRSILSITEDVEAQLSNRRALESGHLRIGYSTYQIAVPYMTRFMRDYPGVQIEARAMASHDLLPQLENGELDVCFITAREMPSHLIGQQILLSKLVLAVPPDHPFAARGKITWADVHDQPLIQREKSSGTRRIFEAAAKLAQARLNTILSVGSWGTISALVKSGLGLGVAMDSEILPSDGLVAVEIDDRALTANHYAVCLPEMRNVAAVKRFLELTEGQCDGSATSGNS